MYTVQYTIDMGALYSDSFKVKIYVKIYVHYNVQLYIL